MEFYTKEKLNIGTLVIDGITLVESKILFNEKIESFLRYASNDNSHSENSDIICAYYENELVGVYVGESKENDKVKPYASEKEELYFIKRMYYKNEKVFEVLLKYMCVLARARGNAFILFNNEKKEYEEFYSLLRKIKGINEVDDYLFMYVYFMNIEDEIDGSLEIRRAYIGEEYDLDKDSPLLMEDNETNLAYLEDNNLRYTLGMSYLVIYDNSKQCHLGYLVAENIRVKDDEVYNCSFIKNFFIYEESDYKEELAGKLFDYLLKLSEYCSCKYLKVKINEDKRYSYFYDYCKIKLKMIEKEGYLIKKIL